MLPTASCRHGVSCISWCVQYPCVFTPRICTAAALAMTSVTPFFLNVHVTGSDVVRSRKHPAGLSWLHGLQGLSKECRVQYPSCFRIYHCNNAPTCSLHDFHGNVWLISYLGVYVGSSVVLCGTTLLHVIANIWCTNWRGYTCIACLQVAQRIIWDQSCLVLSSWPLRQSGLFRDARCQMSLLCPRLLTSSAWEPC